MAAEVSVAETFDSELLQGLRVHALSLPETSEGTSCVNRAFKVRKKNFVFLGEKPDGTCRLMVKLGPSLEKAAAIEHDGLSVGTTGWVTWNFAGDAPPEASLLEGWVVESFRMLAPKTVVRQLDP